MVSQLKDWCEARGEERRRAVEGLLAAPSLLRLIAGVPSPPKEPRFGGAFHFPVNE
jgi:hypothetical protein